jgi:hypothetical protein
MMDCVSKKKFYNMAENVDDATAYDNHPYEDKKGMVRMLIQRLVKEACKLL